MAVAYNTDVVRDSLMLYVDAANAKSPVKGATDLVLNGGMSPASQGYYSFDGSDDTIGISSSVYDQTYSGKTISVLAYMDTNFGSPNIFRAMIGTSSSVSLRNFNLYIYRDGTGFRFHYSQASFGGFSNYLPLSLQQWFYGSLVHRSDGTHTYYFNAVPIGTGNFPFAQLQPGTTELLGAADNRWFGRIALWQVYSKALTDNEILKNFRAIRGRYAI